MLKEFSWMLNRRCGSHSDASGLQGTKPPTRSVVRSALNAHNAAQKTEARDASCSRRAESSRASEAALAAAQAIDPVRLEAELRSELHQALLHLDNCVDLLGVASLQQISTFMKSQASVDEEASGNKFSPELAFHDESRSFSLYWRRIVKVFRQQGRFVSYTVRMPIRKSAESDEIGYSMQAFRSVKSEELREYIRSTERRFRDLRKAMRSIVLARIKLGVADASATKYFDEAIIGSGEGRIRSSALTDDWPLSEEEPKLKFLNGQKSLDNDRHR